MQQIYPHIILIDLLAMPHYSPTAHLQTTSPTLKTSSNHGLVRPKNIAERRGVSLSIESRPFNSLETSPPRANKTSQKREELRLSSYQLYKEQQRVSRFNNSNKISLLRSKYLSQKYHPLPDHTDKRMLISSNLLKVHGSYIHPMETEQERMTKSREVYIQTSEGRRKKIDPNAYFERLKTKHYNPRSLINLNSTSINPEDSITATPIAHSLRTFLKRSSHKKYRHAEGIKMHHERSNPCRPWSPFVDSHIITDLVSFCEAKQ